jgi:hypothetical protein
MLPSHGAIEGGVEGKARALPSQSGIEAALGYQLAAPVFLLFFASCLLRSAEERASTTVTA